MKFNIQYANENAYLVKKYAIFIDIIVNVID